MVLLETVNIYRFKPKITYFRQFQTYGQPKKLNLPNLQVKFNLILSLFPLAESLFPNESNSTSGVKLWIFLNLSN